MDYFKSIALAIALFGGTYSYAQQDQYLVEAFQYAKETGIHADFLNARARTLSALENNSINEEEIDQLIILIRPYRDTELISLLFNKKEALHAHEKGTECTCGKHTPCHEE